MTVLRSYVSGAWIAPADDGRPVLDAVTGEEVARVSSAGIDLGAALAYGRSAGGPALRELTFHQRAALLKSLGMLLREHRQELYALSARTGATLGDSKFDVDGGIGVLLSYASKARRELPNDTILAEGAVEPLGKGGTFVGQHILTPLHGVAVQINAFNFPVWGPLEKFAPAFIAGVPSLVKPATQTAYLTARLVELIVDSGLLPEGSIQLVCGSVGDLFDHLGEQDLVSFTGSAATARQLRAHPAIVGRSIRFNAEADSLNCSVLGPEAGPGTPEFDLYVRQLVTEMTVKAGQKCTAIRRALVPAALADQVAEAARDRLAKVVVGNPAEEGVRMGALAGLEQREEVRRSVKALLSAGWIVFGDPDHVDVVGASAERGAFMAPLLLRADEAGRPEPHQVEAFGPVSTIIGYRDTAEVIDLAARGRGSLAGSIVTADIAFARDVVLGLAPWHGRLLVLDREDGAESTGHGSPLPALVHGGPGRAGGGEEMGGIRGVLHYMQRTAVQASPRVLSAVTRTWIPGTERNADGGHPFRKSLAELRIGDTVVAGPRRVTLADIEHFAEFTGDTFYAHMDEEAARANPFFDGRIAHGYLIVSFAAGLFVQPDPGPVLANYGLENLRFLTPVYPGDELTVTLTCKQITPREDAGYGEVRWDVDVTNQDGKSVASYDVLTLVAKEWPPAVGAAAIMPGPGRARPRSGGRAGSPAQVPPTSPRPAATPSGSMREITPSSSSSPAGPPTTRTCAGSWPSVRTARRKFDRQHGQLEPQPDRPPFARPVVAVERQPAAGPVHGEHARRRGGRRDVQEPAGAVLGLEPLPAVHPDARAALDPVGGRPRDAEHLRHRRGEQFAGSRGHHAEAGRAGPITSMVPAPKSTTSASSRAPGVVRAPSRAAAGSVTGLCTGMSSRSPRTAAACASPARLSEATSTARPVLPCRAVAASAAAARSTANRSSTSTAAGAAPAAAVAGPNARTAPTGQPASRAHAARSGRRSPSAVIIHGSAGTSATAGAAGSRPTTALA